MVDLVGLGRPVATTFRCDHMDHRWSTEAADLPQGALDVLDVVAVDRARILDAEVLEEGARRDELLETFLDAAYGFDRFVTGGNRAKDSIDALLRPVIRRVEDGELLGQVLRQAADGGRVGPAVVIDDDDHGRFAVTDIVERLVSHPACQGAIADDDDHVSGLSLPPHRLRHPRGVAESGRCVAVLDEVMLALRTVGVATHAAQLATPRKSLAGTRQQLVDVRLVAGVPEDPVPGALEHPMERQGQLDDAEVGAEVATGLGDARDQELADFVGQGAQLRIAQGAKIGRTHDPVENWCAGNLVHIRFESSEEPPSPCSTDNGDNRDLVSLPLDWTQRPAVPCRLAPMGYCVKTG